MIPLGQREDKNTVLHNQSLTNETLPKRETLMFEKEEMMNRSDAVATAYDRFRLLVANHMTTTSGIKSPITTGNTPLSYKPCALRPATFSEYTRDTDKMDVDIALSKHSVHLKRVDQPYSLCANNYSNGKSAIFPPSLTNEYITQYSKRFKQNQPIPHAQRTCTGCWTSVGTLYCKECTTYLCAPCAVQTHWKHPYNVHYISTVSPPQNYNLHDDGRKDLQKFPRHQSKMKKSPGLFPKEILQETEAPPKQVIGFRPLPNPNHELAPLSRKVLRVFCRTHTETPVTYCCKTCGFLPICDLCVTPTSTETPENITKSHKNHDVISLSEGAAICRKEIEALRQDMQQELTGMRQAERNLRLIERTAPGLLRSLDSRTHATYKKFFQALAEKYTHLHNQLSNVQTTIARTVKILAEDNMKFRKYLTDFKIEQLRALVKLGDRNPSAGLNAYVILKPSISPLLDPYGGRYLIDAEDPTRHPWWQLNPGDARNILKPIEEDVKLQCYTIVAIIAAITTHVQRYLKPTEAQKRHPISAEIFLKKKLEAYTIAKTQEDLEPLQIIYTGPIPHTPEFSKLLPTLEGLMFRKDALNDWSVVRLALIEPFLVVPFGFNEQNIAKKAQDINTNDINNDNTEDDPYATAYLRTETVVSLLDKQVTIKRFADKTISELTKQELIRAKKIHGLTIVDGLEIIRSRQNYSITQTFVQDAPPLVSDVIPITAYWLLGTDTQGAADLWMQEIEKIRSSSRSFPDSIRIPTLFPGMLPPQAGIRHPPLTSSHKRAAVESFGVAETNTQSIVQEEPFRLQSSTVHFSADMHSDTSLPNKRNPSFIASEERSKSFLSVSSDSSSQKIVESQYNVSQKHSPTYPPTKQIKNKENTFDTYKTHQFSDKTDSDDVFTPKTIERHQDRHRRQSLSSVESQKSNPLSNHVENTNLPSITVVKKKDPNRSRLLNNTSNRQLLMDSTSSSSDTDIYSKYSSKGSDISLTEQQVSTNQILSSEMIPNKLSMTSSLQTQRRINALLDQRIGGGGDMSPLKDISPDVNKLRVSEQKRRYFRQEELHHSQRHVVSDMTSSTSDDTLYTNKDSFQSLIKEIHQKEIMTMSNPILKDIQTCYNQWLYHKKESLDIYKGHSTHFLESFLSHDRPLGTIEIDSDVLGPSSIISMTPLKQTVKTSHQISCQEEQQEELDTTTSCSNTCIVEDKLITLSDDFNESLNNTHLEETEIILHDMRMTEDDNKENDLKSDNSIPLSLLTNSATELKVTNPIHNCSKLNQSERHYFNDFLNKSELPDIPPISSPRLKELTPPLHPTISHPFLKEFHNISNIPIGMLHLIEHQTDVSSPRLSDLLTIDTQDMDDHDLNVEHYKNQQYDIEDITYLNKQTKTIMSHQRQVPEQHIYSMPLHNQSPTTTYSTQCDDTEYKEVERRLFHWTITSKFHEIMRRCQK